jgi:hypothetical protein
VTASQLTGEEKVYNCLYCDYFVVVPSDFKDNFFYCGYEHCSRVHCTVCLDEIKVKVEINQLEETPDPSKFDEFTKDFEKHFKCAEMNNLLVEF